MDNPNPIINPKDFGYAPSARRGPRYDQDAPANLGNYINESIARIEALKIRVLEIPMLNQNDKDPFFLELDMLRGAFIEVGSSQYRRPDLPTGKPTKRKAFSWKDDLIIEGIIGNSPVVQQILRIICSVAPSTLTVLLGGETGTGKELFARIIHLNSGRQTFVAVNCGAFPGGLIESELFGHVKGAFTGATSDRKGKFEEASSGTIFLDEIGELEPYAQVRLLRVLETGELQRVGTEKVRKVDVRVIAATNRNLEQMVQQGTFREDLFYRLNTCPLQLPPLRERRDEIEILLQYFMEEACAKQNKPVPQLDPELRHFLAAIYEFQGNIRELKNIAQFMACIGTPDRLIEIGDLPARYQGKTEVPEGGAANGNGPAHRRLMRLEAEKVYWVKLLQKHKGDLRKICAETNLSRSRVYQVLDECKLRPNAFR